MTYNIQVPITYLFLQTNQGVHAGAGTNATMQSHYISQICIQVLTRNEQHNTILEKKINFNVQVKTSERQLEVKQSHYKNGKASYQLLKSNEGLEEGGIVVSPSQ